MDTEYCTKCGILHDPNDGECLGCKITQENVKLKKLIKEEICGKCKNSKKCKKDTFFCIVEATLGENKSKYQ